MKVPTTAGAAIVAISIQTGVFGQTLPNIPGSMKHILIALEQSTGEITLEMSGDPLERVQLSHYPGEMYSGAASVLNEKRYGDRYGWLNNGFVDPGPGNGIFVEVLSATAGLQVYEGGMRPVRAMHSYDPILSTGGSAAFWQWNGMMTHNWYATDLDGDFEATYSVYVGDELTGAPVPGFTPAEITLYFTAVPAPGASLGLAVGGLFLMGRRRSR